MSEAATGTDGGNWHVRTVRIGEVEFPYHYGVDCADRILQELAGLGADRFIVVTDDTVLKLHGDRLLPGLRAIVPVEVLSQQPGEHMKSLAQLADYAERTLGAHATRRTVVIAFGGGVPGNLAGLLSALIFRGVRLVHIPTTTVSAMDSVLSLKQAINSSLGKNHIGTYYSPLAVYTDIRMLATLPERELRSGLCEAAKNCLAIAPDALPGLRKVLAEGGLNSPDSLLWLLDESIRAKTEVTARDTHEQRAALVLEYGHTAGHAVELADHRLRGSAGLSHGESIALGMIVAARISSARGWLSRKCVDEHEEIVSALGAPLALPGRMTVDDVMNVVRDDNKRGYLPAEPDTVPYVLLKDLGEPAGSTDLPLVPVRLAEIRAALESLGRDGTGASA
ncbi:2-deoxy-scyllo-inosose synthase [Streptomyces sp. NPDC094448]|uniref:2-deoxy-scyllo-inosose synthase n=1 Tax=Streptomyces sp. NPDC094448 TaxID=3366063 RepID=UPI00381F92D4